MRSLTCCLTLSCLILSGCEWMKRKATDGPDIRPKDQVYGPPTAEKLVGYLNTQADRLSVIQSEDVDLTAHVQGKRMPRLVTFMVCEKPRSFRLMGDSVGTTW